MTTNGGPRTTRRTLLRNLGIAGASTAGFVLATSGSSRGYVQEMQVENPEGIWVAWTERYNGEVLEADETDDRDGYGPTIDIGNLLPGDSGSLAIRVQPTAEEGSEAQYQLHVSMSSLTESEGGLSEPEQKGGYGSVSDTTRHDGELAQAIDATVAYDSGVLSTGLLACDGSIGLGEFGTIASGTLEEVVAALQAGLRLDPPGDDGCFAIDEGVCLVLEWALPEGVGNQVQTDSVSFDLTFRCEGCEGPA
jgi:hypothetical protein